MDNSTAPLQSVEHNLYFEGKVQSLGLQTDKGKATVGVMKKGSYTFSASAPERMKVISGVLDVKLKDTEYKKYHEQDEFEVAAGTSFDVICEDDVAYICFYG
ncbi:pyrimidine/purine nucleoside phosphorylase [Pedobacter psychroterrae]|uniref:Pyrimidine/purine nucleoside phosphorylase n=1 Tax=Pedobacter psychroterrae TaxID=2530453 RepID=A0A4R0NRF6_9SPHI|nr:pyrimidine/purine nucleoside phosphorylase [Pedobacter psychroterrae]TCD03712.1 pyrimidine/purine nucleoside phosphorylase [Pedobacter psychroterrae]